MSYLEWRVECVKPGATYDDEPGVEVPSGWYVFGTDPEADVENGPRVVLHVQHAINAEGEWVARQVARSVADRMAMQIA